MRAVSLILTLILCVGSGAGAFACPGTGASACCPEQRADPGNHDRLERVCCCIEPEDAEPHRPADSVGSPSRPTEDFGVPPKVATNREPLPMHDGRVAIAFSFHSFIPPPTLLHARTSFLC